MRPKKKMSPKKISLDPNQNICTLTNAMTKELEIQYTLRAGMVVTISFEASYSIVDNGIGHYEYWGARGFDRQLDTECDDVGGFEICNLNGDWVGVSPAEMKEIKDAAFEYACENCPEVEECVDNDYDADQDRKDRDDWRDSRRFDY